MFIETLETKFKKTTPIFTKEILEAFPQWTKAYVYRLLDLAVKAEKMRKIDSGIYYIPESTVFGQSIVLPSQAMQKKYISDNNETYGIYCGLMLQNAFSLTTQMANTTEIITNRTAARYRRITIRGMKFIVRKARVPITKENASTYCVLQIFTEKNGIKVTERGKKAICDYIRQNNITNEDLLNLSKSFPASTLQNLIYSGVLNEAL